MRPVETIMYCKLVTFLLNYVVLQGIKSGREFYNIFRMLYCITG